MRLLDANLLVYSYVESMPQHAKAKSWLDQVLNGVPRVGIPWHSSLTFVRLVSNPRIFERPAAIPEAWKQVEVWLACECVWVPEPTERHAEVMATLLRQPGLTANQVPDAHLAGLALEHGLVVCTTDNDFHRFSGIKTENPLE